MTPIDLLVGRHQVRQVLTSALGEAIAGRGGCVLIGGEPGIGKSAMLGWLSDQLPTGGLVLRGNCWDGGGVAPYWPWVQIVRSAGTAAPDLEAVGWVAGPVGSDQAGAVAADRGAGIDVRGRLEVAAGAGDAADARFRLFDAVARTLSRLAARQPILVLIDDLQWADESSLQLLSFIGPTVAGERILLVGAYRDTEASDELVTLTARAEHLVLGGLDPAEVTAMVVGMPGAALSPDQVLDIRRRSGGNPFFVRELTRLVQAQHSGPPGRLPISVTETIRRRLARLSSDCVQVLDWAAVAGPDIDPALLVAVGAAPDEPAVDEILAAAVRAGVLTAGRSPRFTHDLYREAVLAAQPIAALASRHRDIGHALAARADPGLADRIGAHLAAAGPAYRREAAAAFITAATGATRRLGHGEAVALYERALDLLDPTDPQRPGLLLDLAAGHDRAGMPGPAMATYREAFDQFLAAGDVAGLGRAALGMHGLGHRSGALDSDVQAALETADRELTASARFPDVHSRVVGALSRELRHSNAAVPDEQVERVARRAVALAERAGDADAAAAAQLAVHDAVWRPGSSVARLSAVAAMLEAAIRAGDADLVAQAHLLRATALLEQGDPAGRGVLREYVRLAEKLGHARGRWGGLTRRATLAQIAGRTDEATRLSERALALGRAIGEPDAAGCFATLRWSLLALGAEEPVMPLDLDDPLWPFLPVLRAWSAAVREDVVATRQVLGDFSVLDVPPALDLEKLAATAVVFSVAGSDDQRRWTYEQLLPHAGTHVVVGGCAAYHAAVDHHLGTLARSLGDRDAAHRHFSAAVGLHERLGAAGWRRLSAAALAALSRAELPSAGLIGAEPSEEFRPLDGGWSLSFRGKQSRLPDAKGLRDLHTLIGSAGVEVHVFDLLDPSGSGGRRSGADPLLDRQAKAQYRARLAELERAIVAADERGDAAMSDRLATERSALIAELSAATGLGGRPRRLGDSTERARKTVSARIRDSLGRIERMDPELATHLRVSLRLGTRCAYLPAERPAWRLR